MDYSIGELARLMGLTVKTIRYYSEIGLVPEASRTSSGYRRYDDAGMARLELVRTLRDLGIDLAAIRHIADQRMTLEEVAGAHGRQDDPGYRAGLADRLASFSDRRVERYWQLLGIINGWPERASHIAPYEWFIAGLRAS